MKKNREGAQPFLSSVCFDSPEMINASLMFLTYLHAGQTGVTLIVSGEQVQEFPIFIESSGLSRGEKNNDVRARVCLRRGLPNFRVGLRYRVWENEEFGSSYTRMNSCSKEPVVLPHSFASAVQLFSGWTRRS